MAQYLYGIEVLESKGQYTALFADHNDRLCGGAWCETVLEEAVPGSESVNDATHTFRRLTTARTSKSPCMHQHHVEAMNELGNLAARNLQIPVFRRGCEYHGALYVHKLSPDQSFC